MGKPKGPDQAAIRATVPLSKLPTRGPDPADHCNICGLPSDSLRLWREGDEWKHPRLYTEVRGNPGHLPALCGPCTFRSGFECSHPDLKSNGGAGLHVSLSSFALGAIVCGPGGCRTPLPRAVECVGQKLPGDELVTEEVTRG